MERAQAGLYGDVSNRYELALALQDCLRKCWRFQQESQNIFEMRQIAEPLYSSKAERGHLEKGRCGYFRRRYVEPLFL